MSHKLREDNPVFYKHALKGLFASAKEHGVNIKLKDNYIIFDDEKNGITTTECWLEVVTEVLQEEVVEDGNAEVTMQEMGIKSRDPITKYGCYEHNGEVNYCESCIFAVNKCSKKYKTII